MDFKEKLKIALDELEKSSIRKSSYNPPISKLLRFLGLKVRPPYYQSFVVNFLVMGITFGVLMGAYYWFMGRVSQLPMFSNPAELGLMSGCIFGTIMSVYYKSSSKRHGLSKWDNISNTESPSNRI